MATSSNSPLLLMSFVAMVEFKFIEYGTDFGTSDMGQKLREKLLPLAELKRRTTFRGLNPLAERSVLVALQRRYKVLSGA